MRKQEVVLKEQADRSSLGRHQNPVHRIFQHHLIQRDAPGPQREEAGQRSQQSGLPGPVRP